MFHENKQSKEIDHAAQKKVKLGVILFLIYTIIYAGFVAIGLTRPEWLSKEVFRGQNLSIVYGFGLIFLAIVMGFVYNYICTKMEDQFNNKS